MRSILLVLLLGAVAMAADAQTPDSTRQRATVSAALLETEMVAVGGDSTRRETITRLTGDVRVRQGETVLTSRRAVRYLDRGTIHFFGDVVIVERGDTLRSPEVRYDERTKTGEATGPLRLTDGEVVVTAPRGTYFTREKRAAFDEGVQLVDSATVLTSETGVYLSDEKRAEFAGNVHLDEPRSTLDADSVTYLRETKESFARGHVFVERRGGDGEADADSTQRTFLFGQKAYSDERRGFSRVEGDSLLQPLLARVRFDTAGAALDTFLLRAPLLESERRDSLQTFRAWGGVAMWSPDYAARADSAFSLRTEADSTTREDVRLFGSPFAWFDRVQVNADTLRVLATGGDLDTLFARSNAFAVEPDTVSGRLHQLKGRAITGFFLPDSVRVIDVRPNAEMIRQQTKDGQPDGLTQASGDWAVFQFRGEDIKRVAVAVGMQGTMYPENLVPPDLTLDGLRWRPDDRPSKAVLLGTYALPLFPGSALSPPASDADTAPPDDEDS